jgi:hypothetical protein
MSYGIGHEVDNKIITNTEAWGNVSNKYIATSTQDIIDELSKYRGVKPVGFSASRVLTQEKHGAQKHMVMLEAEDAEMLDGNLRIVLFNSHDRSTAIRMYLGFYRDACANDCVFGDDVMTPISIRHTKKDWKYTVFSLMQEYEAIEKRTEDMIQRMMKKYVSYGDIGRFNERVAEMLNRDITGTILDPTQLNAAHREEDVGKNAWLMYQRAQYNVINGGIDRVVSTIEEDTAIITSSISKTHLVSDAQKQIRYNQQLHKLAMELL